MNEVLIKVENFRKEFGPKVVFENLNLDIGKNQVFGVVGMSGSGKTTFLNSLIGFLTPEEGDVLFKSGNTYKSVYEHPYEVNKIFGFASQQASVYPKLTAIENLDHFGSLYDLSAHVRKTNAQSLLRMIGLEDSQHTLAQDLSGGMQKRLSIACALIHDPKILILDEPTSDLDPLLRKQAWDFIRRINNSGTTVIVASHFLDEIENNCDRVAIIHKGKVLAVGTPDELRNSYTVNFEIHLETVDARYDFLITQLRTVKYVDTISREHHRLVIFTPQPQHVLRHVVRILDKYNVELLDLYVNKPTLSEVFEYVTKNSKSS